MCANALALSYLLRRYWQIHCEDVEIALMEVLTGLSSLVLILSGEEDLDDDLRTISVIRPLQVCLYLLEKEEGVSRHC